MAHIDKNILKSQCHGIKGLAQLFLCTPLKHVGKRG